jgi:hypothetical protein
MAAARPGRAACPSYRQLDPRAAPAGDAARASDTNETPGAGDEHNPQRERVGWPSRQSNSRRPGTYSGGMTMKKAIYYAAAWIGALLLLAGAVGWAVTLTSCNAPELAPAPGLGHVERHELQADEHGLATLQVDGADDLDAVSVTCWRKLFTPAGELHSFELLADVWIWEGGHVIAQTDPRATVLFVVVRYAER